MSGSSGVSLSGDLPERVNTALGILYGVVAFSMVAYTWVTPSPSPEGDIGVFFLAVFVAGEMILFIAAGNTYRSMRERLDADTEWVLQFGLVGPGLSIVGIPLVAAPGIRFTVHILGFLVTLVGTLAGTGYMAYDGLGRG